MLNGLGLSDHIYKKSSELSGGQKQRTAISRALINDTDIIVADEPTGSLDPKTSMQVLNIMRGIAERGKLVIMVTHSEKIAACSSRIIKIEDGKIIDDSELKKLKSEPILDRIDSLEKNINKTTLSLNITDTIKLTIINMKEKILGNILIYIAASIGIASLILILSFGQGIKTYFNRTMNSYVNPLTIEVNMTGDDPETVNLELLR